MENICKIKTNLWKHNKHKDITLNITFKCNHCNKLLSSRQSKWRHEKICTNKNTLDKRITKLENIHNINYQFITDILDKQILTIQNISNIINNYMFNKTIINLHSQLFINITYSIDAYKNIANQFDYHNNTVKANILIMNKIDNFKNKYYLDFVNKLKLINKQNNNNNKNNNNNNNHSDSDSDSDNSYEANSIYSDISDF